MITQGLPVLNNGNEMIAFTNKDKLGKAIRSVQDLPTMYDWYREDPDKRHLGLMKFWDYKTQRPSGILDELLTTKAVLTVNGWDGKFSYDLPVDADRGCYTTKDMSHQKKAGIDGDTFKVILNKEFKTGDVLTYDLQRGQQFTVVDDEPVIEVAEGFEHTVILVDNDKSTWFTESFLNKGIQYYKVSHNIHGEYGTNFSGFEYGDTQPTMRCEFQLGAATGVEAYITGLADSKQFSGMDAQSQSFIQRVATEFKGNDIAMIVDIGGDKATPNFKTARIGATLEYLTLRELHRLTNSKLMWQAAGEYKGSNGVTRINEGLFKQMRRGTIYKYGRKGGITRQHLIDMGTYIFRNNLYLDEELRELEFRCGKYAYLNVLEVFDKEFTAQYGALGLAGLLGANNGIPNPIKGNDLTNLELGLVRFTRVFIKGLGWLRVIHDKSLDVLDEGMDRRVKGDNPEGFAPTTYSIFISDVANQRYSNNKELPKGTKMVDGGRDDANIYLVKPEGEMTYWGTTRGRYDYQKSSNIISSMKQLGQEFWAYNIMDIHLLDPSRVLILELDDSVSYY